MRGSNAYHYTTVIPLKWKWWLNALSYWMEGYEFKFHYGHFWVLEEDPSPSTVHLGPVLIVDMSISQTRKCKWWIKSILKIAGLIPQWWFYMYMLPVTQGYISHSPAWVCIIVICYTAESSVGSSMSGAYLSSNKQHVIMQLDWPGTC